MCNEQEVHKVVAVDVRFQGGWSSTKYAFLYDIGKPIKPGDKAVVYGAQSGRFEVVDIVGIHHDKAPQKATAYVVDIVDMTSYKEREEKKIRIKAIQGQLKEKVKAFSEDVILELLVTRDPVAAKLVEQLKELNA